MTNVTDPSWWGRTVQTERAFYSFTPTLTDADFLTPEVAMASAKVFAQLVEDGKVDLPGFRKPVALPVLPTPTDTRPALVARPVCTVDDALVMGRIRHEQRAGFSADNSAIDEDRQRRWWAEMRQRCNAFLYYTHKGELVGYGALIQREDGTWVSSLAILPEHTGRSYGKRLVSHLINSVSHEVYARALVSNPAAVALHNPMEWEQTGVDDTCVHFRTKPKIRIEYPVTLGGYE